MNRQICCASARVSLLAVCFGGLVFGLPAFGQGGTCMADEFGGTLNCTANDVSVAKVTGVTIVRGGVGNSCLQGSTFDFVADFEIVTTSSKARSNIGLFFGTGQSNALNGTCSDAILYPKITGVTTCPGTGGAGQPAAITCGDANYEELDQAINGETSNTTGSGPTGCGDSSSSDNGAFGPGTQAAELEITNVTCPTTTVPCPAGSPIATCMALPECTSWYQPASGMPVCEASPPYPWQTAAIPGTKSKCSCTTLLIPVQPVQPTITVAKTCNTGTISGTPSGTHCDIGPEGTTVTYTVTITNTTPAGEGGVVVDQICDNQYGTVYDDGTIKTACAAGLTGNSIVSASSTCGSLGTISTSASCTFEAAQGENASVIDSVTVKGHSSLVSTSMFPPKTSNSVTVVSEDAPSTATTNKGLEPGPQAACVTVRYNVTVANSSSADETLSLSSAAGPPIVPALNDNAYGDLSTTHGSASVDGSVTGTTCGVAANNSNKGLGTLNQLTVVSPGTTVGAGEAPGGAFPDSLATSGSTSSYTCWFDGVICGTPSAIPPTCTYGLSKSDTVAAHLTGDDLAPNADTVSQTDNQFIANVCLTQF